jgi:antitoxin component YwqK of YwqJK toxin-antitoxin module
MKTYKVTVDEEGTKRWYLNDKRHREDGPAVEWTGGYKAWYLNGNLHREDGPAVECSDGNKSWYINGEKLTEEEFDNRKKPCIGKKVVIDGIEYTLK